MAALPDRATPLGIVPQVCITLVLCVLVWLAPPGQFVTTHVFQQAHEVVEILRQKPDRGGLSGALLGQDFLFVDFVREHTPERSVILMSDQFAPSSLEPLKAKSQRWASFFLYPRRVLYLHQEEALGYRDATWLVLDGVHAVEWIDPSIRPAYEAGELRLNKFDMRRYLEDVQAGRIDARWLPPSEPLRAPKHER